LIALIRQGRWRKDEDIVFLHTGGAPALFAYQSALGHLNCEAEVTKDGRLLGRLPEALLNARFRCCEVDPLRRSHLRFRPATAPLRRSHFDRPAAALDARLDQRALERGTCRAPPARRRRALAKPSSTSFRL